MTDTLTRNRNHYPSDWLPLATTPEHAPIGWEQQTSKYCTVNSSESSSSYHTALASDNLRERRAADKSHTSSHPQMSKMPKRELSDSNFFTARSYVPPFARGDFWRPEYPEDRPNEGGMRASPSPTKIRNEKYSDPHGRRDSGTYFIYSQHTNLYTLT